MLTRREHLRFCLGLLAGSLLPIRSGSAKCGREPPVAPPNGLLDPAIARTYIINVRALFQRWPSLDAKRRMQALVHAVNDALRKAQVPGAVLPHGAVDRGGAA